MKDMKKADRQFLEIADEVFTELKAKQGFYGIGCFELIEAIREKFYERLAGRAESVQQV